jgi:hypothetical protein
MALNILGRATPPSIKKPLIDVCVRARRHDEWSAGCTCRGDGFVSDAISSVDMNTGTDAGGERRQWHRRGLLRSIASAGAVGAVGVAAGQTGTDGGAQDGQLRAVIPEQQQYDGTVTGFFIHIGAEVDPLKASVADQCDLVDWADDETLAYDAQLVDRQAAPETQSITLYLHERVEVEPGTLFIVDDREQCESAYLGISLEQTGVNLAQLRSRDFTPNPENQDGGGVSGGAGPGMGVAGALAGLLGSGWLFGRRDD